MTRETKKRWLERNRGFIREIARELDLSHSHISRVFWGITKSAPVLKHIESSMRQRSKTKTTTAQRKKQCPK